jgi:hypothetical protein
MKGLVNLMATVVPKAASQAITAAVITLAATAGVRHVVDQVFGGYDTDPAAGSLTIAVTVNGTAVSMVVPITDNSPFNIPLQHPLQGDVGTAITITLAGGGGAVVANVNALTR